MNDEWTKDYLDKVFGSHLFERRSLVWDAFRCHIIQSTKKDLEAQQIDMAVVPRGCTKFVQAPDVRCNKSFKSKIQELYNDWMAEEKKPVYVAKDSAMNRLVNMYAAINDPTNEQIQEFLSSVQYGLGENNFNRWDD
uniref:DDE-1 domain-containing protein n=1 Tax=Ditylenchus dipsaci TaxID=166011 RepID=A0A915E522_9BILA